MERETKMPKVGDIIQWSRFEGRTETSLIISSDTKEYVANRDSQVVAARTVRQHSPYSRGALVQIMTSDSCTPWLYFNNEDVTVL